MRSRPGDGFVALAATLAAALGLTTLTVTASWLGTAWWTCLGVAVTGIGLRRLTGRTTLVLVGQLLLVGWMTLAIFVGDRFWWGLPGAAAMARTGELFGDFGDVVQKYAAPVPTTPGVSLVLVLAVTGLALLVDYLAVTRGAPAAAGMPLLVAFLTAAANSGSSLPPFYFVVSALLWLVLVSRQGRWSVRRWSTTVASPRSPTRQVDVESDALSAVGSSARQLGVVALVAAVLLPAIVPHLPTRYVLDGLGRADSAVGRGGRVGFNSTLDLTRSLQDGSSNPVLTYRTTAPGTPPPLRVVVTSDYVNGEWRTRPGSQAGGQDLRSGYLVSSQVAVSERTISVESNLLDPPHAASPQPAVAADFGSTSWTADPRTSDLYVRSRADAYTVTYEEVNVAPGQLEAGIPGGAPVPDDVRGANPLALDPGSEPLVRQLAADVTSKAQARTPYETAVAIQSWLRSEGGFSYSLQLVSPVAGPDGRQVTNPLAAFLVSKQGYCVQFASAMVMMARARGIPARMAIGFLPGTAENGLYTVHAADAHSWPELYFPGAGWLRFEPTPSVRTGLAPAYTTPSTVAAGSTTAGRDAASDPNATAAPDAGPRDNGGVQDTSTGGADIPLQDRVAIWLQDGGHLVLLAVVLGLLGTLVLPLTARLVHRRRRARAATSAELAEAQWAELVARLGDLGLSPPNGGTLRDWRRHYAREAYLDEPAERSMGHVVATLERTRYARPGSEPVRIHDDIRMVTKAAASSRPTTRRVRAFFLPSDGIRWWGEALTRVSSAPGRWVDQLVERLSARR
ncbi:MAG: DUF3488 and transglutaminase-like domain-containing protein [Actinomycetota bacterium]|nr:DUF3488 and transglutaminase-like domain-containing protein [Actinomycetota bacterium]